jgi:hypothetical protein
MNNSFKIFLKKLFFFSIPLLIMVGLYFIFDPFHVLRNYESYGSNFLKTYNRNRISTEVFVRNNPTYKFKSFIFGSSRSSAFLTHDWAKYINDPHPYHFDAFNDNIGGIAGKISFIKKQKNTIKNAIIVIDNDTFANYFDETESLVHLKDYRWTDSTNYLAYQLKFFKAFFKKQYFISFLDLKFTKKFKPYMEDFFKFKYFYTDIYNDFLFPENEALIKRDSSSYYSSNEFKNRIKNPEMHGTNIDQREIENIKFIADTFKKDHTNYKIIIAPLYDQRATNSIELEILKIYFGKENVYDYSGKNKFTNDISNYYEMSHFKPSLGRIILKEIY